MSLERSAEWFDRSKQPRCNICGRFAYWDAMSASWKLKCVFVNEQDGIYEHD